jgi:hypothetical protein
VLKLTNAIGIKWSKVVMLIVELPQKKNQQGVLPFDKLVYIINIAHIIFFLRINVLYCLHVKCKNWIFFPIIKVKDFEWPN